MLNASTPTACDILLGFMKFVKTYHELLQNQDNEHKAMWDNAPPEKRVEPPVEVPNEQDEKMEDDDA